MTLHTCVNVNCKGNEKAKSFNIEPLKINQRHNESISFSPLLKHIQPESGYIWTQKVNFVQQDTQSHIQSHIHTHIAERKLKKRKHLSERSAKGPDKTA